VREQEKLRGQMANAFGPSAFDVIGEQVRRNTEMFEQAMRMFLPFGNTRERSDPAPKPAETETRSDADIEALRRQLDEVQKRLDKMSSKG
jgi:polyhydroxyalkanoate synthesis regulator protein